MLESADHDARRDPVRVYFGSTARASNSAKL